MASHGNAPRTCPSSFETRYVEVYRRDRWGRPRREERQRQRARRRRDTAARAAGGGVHPCGAGETQWRNATNARAPRCSDGALGCSATESDARETDSSTETPRCALHAATRRSTGVNSDNTPSLPSAATSSDNDMPRLISMSISSDDMPSLLSESSASDNALEPSGEPPGLPDATPHWPPNFKGLWVGLYDRDSWGEPRKEQRRRRRARRHRSESARAASEDGTRSQRGGHGPTGPSTAADVRALHGDAMATPGRGTGEYTGRTIRRQPMRPFAPDSDEHTNDAAPRLGGRARASDRDAHAGEPVDLPGAPQCWPSCFKGKWINVYDRDSWGDPRGEERRRCQARRRPDEVARTAGGAARLGGTTPARRAAAPRSTANDSDATPSPHGDSDGDSDGARHNHTRYNAAHDQGAREQTPSTNRSDAANGVPLCAAPTLQTTVTSCQPFTEALANMLGYMDILSAQITSTSILRNEELSGGAGALTVGDGTTRKSACRPTAMPPEAVRTIRIELPQQPQSAAANTYIAGRWMREVASRFEATCTLLLHGDFDPHTLTEALGCFPALAHLEIASTTPHREMIRRIAWNHGLFTQDFVYPARHGHLRSIHIVIPRAVAHVYRNVLAGRWQHARRPIASLYVGPALAYLNHLLQRPGQRGRARHQRIAVPIAVFEEGEQAANSHLTEQRVRDIHDQHRHNGSDQAAPLTYAMLLDPWRLQRDASSEATMAVAGGGREYTPLPTYGGPAHTREDEVGKWLTIHGLDAFHQGFLDHGIDSMPEIDLSEDDLAQAALDICTEIGMTIVEALSFATAAVALQMTRAEAGRPAAHGALQDAATAHCSWRGAHTWLQGFEFAFIRLYDPVQPPYRPEHRGRRRQFEYASWLDRRSRANPHPTHAEPIARTTFIDRPPRTDLTLDRRRERVAHAAESTRPHPPNNGTRMDDADDTDTTETSDGDAANPAAGCRPARSDTDGADSGGGTDDPAPEDGTRRQQSAHGRRGRLAQHEPQARGNDSGTAACSSAGARHHRNEAARTTSGVASPGATTSVQHTTAPRSTASDNDGTRSVHSASDSGSDSAESSHMGHNITHDQGVSGRPPSTDGSDAAEYVPPRAAPTLLSMTTCCRPFTRALANMLGYMDVLNAQATSSSILRSAELSGGAGALTVGDGTTRESTCRPTAMPPEAVRTIRIELPQRPQSAAANTRIAGKWMREIASRFKATRTLLLHGDFDLRTLFEVRGCFPTLTHLEIASTTPHREMMRRIAGGHGLYMQGGEYPPQRGHLARVHLRSIHIVIPRAVAHVYRNVLARRWQHARRPITSVYAVPALTYLSHLLDRPRRRGQARHQRIAVPIAVFEECEQSANGDLTEQRVRNIHERHWHNADTQAAPLTYAMLLDPWMLQPDASSDTTTAATGNERQYNPLPPPAPTPWDNYVYPERAPGYDIGEWLNNHGFDAFHQAFLDYGFDSVQEILDLPESDNDALLNVCDEIGMTAAEVAAFAVAVDALRRAHIAAGRPPTCGILQEVTTTTYLGWRSLDPWLQGFEFAFTHLYDPVQPPYRPDQRGRRRQFEYSSWLDRRSRTDAMMNGADDTDTVETSDSDTTSPASGCRPARSDTDGTDSGGGTDGPAPGGGARRRRSAHSRRRHLAHHEAQAQGDGTGATTGNTADELELADGVPSGEGECDTSGREGKRMPMGLTRKAESTAVVGNGDADIIAETDAAYARSESTDRARTAARRACEATRAAGAASQANRDQEDEATHLRGAALRAARIAALDKTSGESAPQLAAADTEECSLPPTTSHWSSDDSARSHSNWEETHTTNAGGGGDGEQGSKCREQLDKFISQIMIGVPPTAIANTVTQIISAVWRASIHRANGPNAARVSGGDRPGHMRRTQPRQRDKPGSRRDGQRRRRSQHNRSEATPGVGSYVPCHYASSWPSGVPRQQRIQRQRRAGGWKTRLAHPRHPQYAWRNNYRNDTDR